VEQRWIGRVPIRVIHREQAMAAILDQIKARKPCFITFGNAHTVNLAQEDDEFAAALAGAMVLNDGVGVDLASRLLHGTPFPSNLAGTDFVPAILGWAPFPLRLFLLGSAPGVAEKAAAKLSKLGPGHEVVGTHDGFFLSDQEGKVRDMIRGADPSLILVGMGQPRQELWAWRNFAQFEATTMCVGALFEFVAGTVSRAPQWMRSARIEWIYRLAQEPKRLWRRYLVGNVKFMARILSDRARRHNSGR
jgi:alpha-1,3-mannosyltransferase